MQPQYAPQYPAQPAAPAYPQQPYPQQYPPQQYAQPAPQYTYPPQQPQYAAPAPQYAPPTAPPPPPGTLDTFYQQPSSGGGPSFKFRDANAQPLIGQSYSGIVARPVTDSDVRAQTNNAGVPQTYKDGRIKYALVVPMQVMPSPEFPEGQAGWWVKGQARDELARAMAEAGVPADQKTPEAGAAITVQLVSVRPVPNMSPAYQYRVTYLRPNGAAPVAAPAMQAPPAQPVQQYAPPAPPMVQQPVQQYAQPAPVQQPVAVAQPAPQQMPTGFDADQQALLARLTGQPVPAQS